MDTIIAASLVRPGMYVREIGSTEPFKRVQEFPVTMFGVISFTASGERVCVVEGGEVEVYDASGEWESEDECEGHESLNGADMGVTVYCDGSCT